MNISSRRQRILLYTLRFVLLAGLCMTAWILYGMDADPTALLAGVVFSVLAAAFSYKTFFSSDFLHRRRASRRLDLLPWYLVILLVQSYRSSLLLLWQMFTRRYTPRVVRIRTRLRSPLAKVMLANSISVIPGTLSMWMTGSHIYVHCFDMQTSHSIAAGRAIKQRQEALLQRIFG